MLPRICAEAAELASNAAEKRYCTLFQFQAHGCAPFILTRASTLPQRLEAEASWGGEAALVAAIEGYEYDIDGDLYKKLGSQLDMFRSGLLVIPLLMRYGAMDAYHTWYTKALGTFEALDLRESRQYGPDIIEVLLITILVSLGPHMYLGLLAVQEWCADSLTP